VTPSPGPSRLWRRFGRNASGSTAVEFAIVGLVLVMMIVGTMRFGHAMLVRHELTNAAERAVRQMLIDESTSEAQLATIVKDGVRFADPDVIHISFGTVTQDARTYRLIAIRYPVNLAVPGVGALSLDLGLDRRVTL